MFFITNYWVEVKAARYFLCIIGKRGRGDEMDKERLEIKSHSDEVLQEVKEYFRMYPNPPQKSSVSTEEIALKNQLKFLKWFMSNEQL